jgi:hypothetical protein
MKQLFSTAHDPDASALVAIGAAAIQTVHVHAKPPSINEISDPERIHRTPSAQKTIKDHGGVYVAAGPGTQIDAPSMC